MYQPIINELPLPALDSPQIKKLSLEWREGYHAYEQILQAEQYAEQERNRAADFDRQLSNQPMRQVQNVVNQRPKIRVEIEKMQTHARAEEERGKVICARTVGYLLLELHARSDILGDTPRSVLVDWVTSPPRFANDTERDVIFGVGKMYRDKLIRLFRASSPPYEPPPSPPWDFFDTPEDLLEHSITTNCCRKRMLARDGFRCIISGLVDGFSLRECKELGKCKSCASVELDMVHILNTPVMEVVDPVEISEVSRVWKKAHDAAGAKSILDWLGFSALTEPFKQAGGVDQVWNVLSLAPGLFCRFDMLTLWFESTAQPHRYEVCGASADDFRFIRRISDPGKHPEGAAVVVNFTSNLKGAPPPDPRLLALHAACARVAHLSGAARLFDQLEWEAEEMDDL